MKGFESGCEHCSQGSFHKISERPFLCDLDGLEVAAAGAAAQYIRLPPSTWGWQTKLLENEKIAQ